MNLEVATVDLVVVGRDHTGQLDVLIVDRLECAVKLGNHQIQATHRLLLKADQVVTEAIPCLERRSAIRVHSVHCRHELTHLLRNSGASL